MEQLSVRNHQLGIETFLPQAVQRLPPFDFTALAKCCLSRLLSETMGVLFRLKAKVENTLFRSDSGFFFFVDNEEAVLLYKVVLAVGLGWPAGLSQRRWRIHCRGARDPPFLDLSCPATKQSSHN